MTAILTKGLYGERGGKNRCETSQGRLKGLMGVGVKVTTFKSPLIEILSLVVTKARWEVAVRSRTLIFTISSVVVGVLVAIGIL